MIVPGDVTPLFFADCDAEVDPAAVWQAGTTPLGSPPTTTSFRNSAYSPLYGRAVAVGDTGTDRRFAYTNDGQNWVRFNSPDDSVSWRCICWADDREEFVALGNPGNVVGVSSTGLPGTWTLQTGVSGAWNAIIRSTRLGLYVAVNNSGSDPGVETSPDAVTWTGRNTGLNNSWYGVADSPSLGRLLVVGAKNADAKDTMTSNNATSWTSQGLISAGVSTQQWRDLNWNDTLNQFVTCNTLITDIATKGFAVSATGLAGSWTVYGSPDVFAIFSRLAYAPGLGYMSGGDAGTIVFSATGTVWTVSAGFGTGFQVFGLVWGSSWTDHGAFSAVSANVTATSAKIFKPYLPC